MISKTLMIWHGNEENDDSTGACVHLSTNLLEHEPGFYIMKNESGEIVARLELMKGCRWRETCTTEGSSL